MITYAALLIGLFFLAGTLVDKKLSEAFPTVDTLIDRDDALAGDRFDILAQVLPDNCDLIIFSGDGEKLYATSETIAETVSFADLPVIASSEEDRRFYEVLEWESDDGEILYEILLCTADGESNADIVKESCICTEDGTIVKGDLFGERRSLSQRELSLIKGMYGTHKTIQKHEYRTGEGESRTLVIMAPVISKSTHNAIVAQAGRIWLFAVPLAIAITIVAVVVLARMVRRMTHPLDQAIDARRKSHDMTAPLAPLPIELHPTYDNFIDLMDQLDRAREDKQRIIANISHDLKTPLTVIAGYTQAFTDGCVPAGKENEYLLAMRERARAATRLIDELVVYSKSEHPAFTASLAPCDLYEQMRLLLARWQLDIENEGDTLVADIPDDTLVIPLDWHLMERAIDNLIGNACIHNPPGITIRASCWHTARSAFVSIADTGKGIPDELRSSAFDPFVTDDTARSSGKGTGLGLSIASSFVRLNGASITFSQHVPEPFKTEAVIVIPCKD